MCKVLIVEDHSVFRQSLKLILSSRFPTLSIEEASTGRAALQQVGRFEPDLVFMDINLPDANGFTLTKAIKTTHANTTVVIITAYDLPEYRQAASEAGASHFISKGSLSEEALFKMVESVITEVSSQ